VGIGDTLQLLQQVEQVFYKYLPPSVPNPELPAQALVGDVSARDKQGMKPGCMLLDVSVGTPLLSLTGLLRSVSAHVACLPSPLESQATFLPRAVGGLQKGFLVWALAAG